MLETNEEIRTGTVKEHVNDHEDENDQNRFLKADTKHIKKQQPMTIEVDIIAKTTKTYSL